MERFGLTIGRIVLIVAAVAGAVLLLLGTDGSPPTLVAAALVLCATGAVVNRAWAALLPLVVVGGWLVVALVAGGTRDPADYTFEQMAMFLVVVAGAFGLCLLLGVWIRRAARRSQAGARASGAR